MAEREQLSCSNMQVPTYLQQTDNRNKIELVEMARTYFWELVHKKCSKDEARKKVFQKTGVVI